MKGWFPYDRYDHWKKLSLIVAIVWKPLFNDRSDYSNHMETGLYENCLAIKIATTAQLFWSDRSDHMETALTVNVY